MRNGMHEGHRMRLVERLAQSEESLRDHELLEILLFNAIPRKNTNEIAHNLLNTFGGIDGVFEAEIDQLITVDGVGESTAAYLKVISLFYEKVQFGKAKRPVIYNVKDFSEYLTARYRRLSVEVIEVYCLDSQGKVKYCKRYTSKKAESVSVEPNTLFAPILLPKPFAIVLAHNHVGVTCAPSDEDDSFTAQIQTMCSINNIRLYDHVIIGSDGFYSYYLTGKLQKMYEKYNKTNLFEKKDK